MKVLILTHWFPNSQNPVAGTFVAEQVKALSRVCEIKVVCAVPWAPRVRGLTKYFDYSQIPERSDFHGIEVYFPRYFTLPKLFTISTWTYPFTIKKTLAKLRNTFPFDLIHAHALFPDGYTAVLMAEQFGVPSVVTAHGYDVYDLPERNGVLNRACKKAVRNADRLVAVSKWLLTVAETKLGPTSTDAVFIPNGADQSLFFPRDKDACREDLGLAPSKRILLCVAHLRKIKGVDRLLRAFVNVRNKFPDVDLYIVGHGPELANLISLRNDLGLTDAAFFPGAMPHADLPIWFNAADLVVVPSVNESFGTVIVEAMCCGKPIVATDVGGISELVASPGVGLLTAPGDTDDLANKIGAALSRAWDPAVINTHGAGYSWQSVAKKLHHLYEGLIDEH